MNAFVWSQFTFDYHIINPKRSKIFMVEAENTIYDPIYYPKRV